MTCLPFPHWVDALEDSDRAAVEGYARDNLVFCHNLDVAQAVQPLRPVLVDEAGHWALGQVLRAIIEDQQDYWRWVANPGRHPRR